MGKMKKKIFLDKKLLEEEDLYKLEEKFRKERAKFSFEKKIKILVGLQKLAYSWGKKRIMIWRI